MFFERAGNETIFRARPSVQGAEVQIPRPAAGDVHQRLPIVPLAQVGDPFRRVDDGHRLRCGRWISPVVVRGVDAQPDADLPQVGHAPDHHRPPARRSQRRHQQRGQQRKDRDHHQQLDQRKRTVSSECTYGSRFSVFGFRRSCHMHKAPRGAGCSVGPRSAATLGPGPMLPRSTGTRDPTQALCDGADRLSRESAASTRSSARPSPAAPRWKVPGCSNANSRTWSPLCRRWRGPR